MPIAIDFKSYFPLILYEYSHFFPTIYDELLAFTSLVDIPVDLPLLTNATTC
jgi:hypothetical protein